MTPAEMVAGLAAGELTLAECDALVDTMDPADLHATITAADAMLDISLCCYDTVRGLIDLRDTHLAESFDHGGLLFAAVDTGTYGYAWGIVADGWLAVAGDSLTFGELGSLESWARDTSAADWSRWAAGVFERRLVAR